MTDTVAELAARARELAPNDRARLVDLLLGDMEQAVDAATAEAWRVEVRQRIDAYERGTALVHDANDVIAEARRIVS